MVEVENIRNKVIQGGTYLIFRRAIGFVISFGGMILLMRLIGVKNYGVYASIAGIIAFMTDLCSMGLREYLVRIEEKINIKIYHLAFTFMFVTTIIAMIIGVGLSYPLDYWLHSSDLQLPFLISLMSMPSAAILLPALAIMERDLNYQHIAYFELVTQLLYYASAVAMGFMGLGIWAPIIANLFQGVVAIIVCFTLSSYRPSFYWSSGLLKEMLRFCIGNSISKRVLGIKLLINPLLVGRFIGPEGVAGVALTIRLIEALSFINGVISRIAYSVLSKIQQDTRRLQTAINEAMLIQVFSLVPFLIAFAVLSKWFIPFLLNHNWMSVIDLFPYLALSSIIGAIFSLHMNVLYVRGENWQVTKFGIVYVLLFGGLTIVLLPYLGLVGYAVAELAAIVAYILLHHPVHKICKPSYQSPFLYMSICIPALFVPIVELPWMLVLLSPLLCFVMLSKPRNEIIVVVKHLLRRNITNGRPEQSL